MINQNREKCKSVEKNIRNLVMLNIIIFIVNALETVHRQLNNFNSFGRNKDSSINQVKATKI